MNSGANISARYGAMKHPAGGYVFAARYEKPDRVRLNVYLSDLKRTLEAVYGVIDKTVIEEKYVRRKTGMNICLATGHTANGRYVFARFNPELRIVSEDWFLVSNIMAKYKGKRVVPAKRVTSDVVKLGKTVHQMMHDLFGEDLYVLTKHGEQLRFPLL